MTAPSLVPVQSGNRVKTDRRDSVKLAELLRAGLLRPVSELSEKTYQDRELLRTREQLMQHRSDICRQIKSKLLYHGVDLPEGLRPTWSKAFLEWLASGPTGLFALDISFAALVRSYRDLTGQIEQLTVVIERLAQSEAYRQRVELLRTVKGMGVLTAMVILVELEDLDRFESEDLLASFLGLVPGEHSTGERTRKGHITRTGNKRVRTALVETSWRLIRCAITLFLCDDNRRRGADAPTARRVGGARTAAEGFRANPGLHGGRAAAGLAHGLAIALWFWVAPRHTTAGARSTRFTSERSAARAAVADLSNLI